MRLLARYLKGCAIAKTVVKSWRQTAIHPPAQAKKCRRRRQASGYVQYDGTAPSQVSQLKHVSTHRIQKPKTPALFPWSILLAHLVSLYPPVVRPHLTNTVPTVYPTSSTTIMLIAPYPTRGTCGEVISEDTVLNPKNHTVRVHLGWPVDKSILKTHSSIAMLITLNCNR